MKKITSIVALILVSTSLLNATSQSSKELKVEGRASDCARMARNLVLYTASLTGDNPNGENFQGYLALYNSLYEACYNS